MDSFYFVIHIFLKVSSEANIEPLKNNNNNNQNRDRKRILTQSMSNKDALSATLS